MVDNLRENLLEIRAFSQPYNGRYGDVKSGNGSITDRRCTLPSLGHYRQQCLHYRPRAKGSQVLHAAVKAETWFKLAELRPYPFFSNTTYWFFKSLSTGLDFLTLCHVLPGLLDHALVPPQIYKPLPKKVELMYELIDFDND